MKGRTWTERVSAAAGSRLSLLGEKIGSEWLVYNPLIFRAFHRMALESAPGMASTFAAVFPDAKRYADIGAGTGTFAAELIRRGRSCQACEYSAIGRRFAQRQGVDSRPFDLKQDPPARLDGPFDVAYCFEVAEHLPPDLGKRLVRFVAQQAPIVVFTAAPPGQAGHGHIHLQAKEYWITEFKSAGMRDRRDLSDRVSRGFRENGVVTWLVQNVIVFDRA